MIPTGLVLTIIAYVKVGKFPDYDLMTMADVAFQAVKGQVICALIIYVLMFLLTAVLFNRNGDCRFGDQVNDLLHKLVPKKVLDEVYVKEPLPAEAEEAPAVVKAETSNAAKSNKKVVGDGSTSLEQTVIRWYIDSYPKGVDVFTRVISSTPDVKNSNQNYVGTTPYETTEAFDIKGLTLNNAGDVQIEVTCEKPGYISQKKRFNVLQAIDQKEISTKFNLVED